MYLYLPENKVIRSKNIIGIFDMDTSTVSKKTRDFLKTNQEKNNILTTSSDLPKSFVLCSLGKEKSEIIINKLASKTIVNRLSSEER